MLHRTLETKAGGSRLRNQHEVDSRPFLKQTKENKRFVFVFPFRASLCQPTASTPSIGQIGFKFLLHRLQPLKSGNHNPPPPHPASTSFSGH